jgi:hypothetical protein
MLLHPVDNSKIKVPSSSTERILAFGLRIRMGAHLARFGAARYTHEALLGAWVWAMWYKPTQILSTELEKVI